MTYQVGRTGTQPYSPARGQSATTRSSMDGPFHDVDLGSPPRARASGLSETVRGVAQLVGVAATGAKLSLKGRLSIAKENALDLAGKAKHGLASAKQAMSREAAALIGKFTAPSRPPAPAATATVATPAPSPKPPATLQEIVEHTYTAVKSNVHNTKSFLRNAEIQYADSSMRSAMIGSLKPKLDSLIGDMRRDARLAAIKEPSPTAVDGFDARGRTERCLDNLQKYVTSLYGDGSDASLSDLVDGFGQDFHTLAFTKRQAVVDGTASADEQRHLHGIMSGQEGSLRTTAPYIITEMANSPDAPGNDDLKLLAKVLQWASTGSTEKLDTEKIPDDMKPRVEHAIANLHSLMLRSGEIAAQKGASVGGASVSPTALQHILEREHVEEI